MEFAPVIGPIGRIAKATLGKAQDVGSGIMGSKPVQSITSAPGGFTLFGDLKNMAGGIFGGLGSFLPGGGVLVALHWRATRILRSWARRPVLSTSRRHQPQQ